MLHFLSLFRYLKDPKVLLGLGVIALGVYIYVLHTEIENRDEIIVELNQTIKHRDETITTLKQANTDLVATIEQYKQDLSEQNKIQQDLQKTNANLSRELRQTISELERAKGRQELVWQRPTLVERFLRTNWK